MIPNSYQKETNFSGRKAVFLKQITSSLLLFLALSSQMGSYVVYLVQQELNKENIAQQMARKLPEEQLVKIKNCKEIKWEEEGKEFYLGDTFYDVVKTKKVNGELWYYCINDTMESQLYNGYSASIKSNNEALPSSNQNKKGIKFSLSYFILTINNNLFEFNNLEIKYFNCNTLAINRIFLEVNAPPPKLA